MGNSTSKKRKQWASNKGSSTDVEPGGGRDLSPFRKNKSRDFSPLRFRAKTEPPLGNPVSSNDLLDVPGKPGKVIVTLTNLQSEKPSGSCVTDSIYLDWTCPIVDGGRPILGYSVEMYDLPTGNWVMVTQTDGDICRSMLDNILCGIMYRFRVRAFNEIGNSVPGIPSDAFVIDTPGVHIAPYFILCPPPEVEKQEHETVQVRAKALGTPKPNILWQKDGEPIFITEGIDIEEESDGSLLTVHNLQLEDDGLIECVAVNHVGKAVSSTYLRVMCGPKFVGTNPNSSLQFTFRSEELIRLKFPFTAQPPPDIQILRDDDKPVDCEAFVREDQAIFRIDCAAPHHAASYTIVADNGRGKDQVTFVIDIEVPPDPPGPPEILSVSPTGQLSMAWDPPTSAGHIDHYIVEYFRDQWQLWLRMKTCIDPHTTVTDLIPGSKYKFRVMSASVTGISEPSQESEEVMIGKAAEDVLFDLPGLSRGREVVRNRMLGRTRKMPSLDRTSLDRNIGPDRRHTSLDREVYYDADNVRRDVVTYKGVPDSLGNTVGNHYKLSNDELTKYRSSMSLLCHKMKAVSNNAVGISGQGSRSSGLNDSMLALKLEVSNQARKSDSLGQLDRESSQHIDRLGVARDRHISSVSSSNSTLTRRKESAARRSELSIDSEDCKKSLTDIRDRIGSLQSLLKASQKLTCSKQHLLADLPNAQLIDQDKVVTPAAPKTHARKLSTLSNRSDSYAMAIDDDDELEAQYQETHFPYNPESASSISLLCDKPENRQKNEDNKEEVQNPGREYLCPPTLEHTSHMDFFQIASQDQLGNSSNSSASDFESESQIEDIKSSLSTARSSMFITDVEKTSGPTDIQSLVDIANELLEDDEELDTYDSNVDDPVNMSCEDVSSLTDLVPDHSDLSSVTEQGPDGSFLSSVTELLPNNSVSSMTDHISTVSECSQATDITISEYGTDNTIVEDEDDTIVSDDSDSESLL